MAKLADFERQLRNLGGDLERKGLLEIQIAIGNRAIELVDQAVRSTPVKPGRSLADQNMSGFKAKGETKSISARYRPKAESMRIAPPGNAYGRMSILESGTKAYDRGEQRVRKRYKSKKTGLVTERLTTVKHKRGAQAGKGTWSRASQAIEAEYLEIARKTVHNMLNKVFGVY